jgi:hypothetical protein
MARPRHITASPERGVVRTFSSRQLIVDSASFLQALCRAIITAKISAQRSEVKRKLITHHTDSRELLLESLSLKHLTGPVYPCVVKLQNAMSTTL